MNTFKKPYFIVTQFYGSDSFQAFTLRSLIHVGEDTEFQISGSEHWLHIVTQLTDSLSYLHSKKILHNDIKSDNVVVICNSGIFYSPVLIDFGKASFISETKKTNLTKEEKAIYYKEYYHIAPEVIEGTCAQSTKSDVYALGVVIAGIYRFHKCPILKELAKRCLKPMSARCTSSDLLNIISNLEKL